MGRSDGAWKGAQSNDYRCPTPTEPKSPFPFRNRQNSTHSSLYEKASVIIGECPVRHTGVSPVFLGFVVSSSNYRTGSETAWLDEPALEEPNICRKCIEPAHKLRRSDPLMRVEKDEWAAPTELSDGSRTTATDVRLRWSPKPVSTSATVQHHPIQRSTLLSHELLGKVPVFRETQERGIAKTAR